MTRQEFYKRTQGRDFIIEDEIFGVDFNEEELQEAIDWFTSSVANIYMDLEFLDKIQREYDQNGKDLLKFDRRDFFCNELCGVRTYCPRSQSYTDDNWKGKDSWTVNEIKHR